MVKYCIVFLYKIMYRNAICSKAPDFKDINVNISVEIIYILGTIE